MPAFQINVVLVRTIYDSNIGASSRAMSNMGADRLILIDHKCAITLKAHQAAASGQKALENRKVYNTWDEFYAGEPDGIRIAFTARDGKDRQVRDLKETLEWISKENDEFKNSTQEGPVPVYLIFGPEDWGLSAEDLEFSHFACSIPTFGDNWSLNLAQAVLLGLYTVRTTWGGQRTRLDGQQSQKRGLRPEGVFPENTLKLWLKEMGFDIDSARVNVYSILKRMLLHNVPTKKELRVLETVLQQSRRKLQEYNDMRKEKGLPAVENPEDSNDD